jgi:cell fate (sporulation/competence/biofilm development) regulator YlbF (YheA/YmcA/DUF963 family)
MDEITDLAVRLGRAIAASPQFLAMKASELKARKNQQIQEITTAYEAQMKRIRELERQNKPIEPEDKRKLAEMRERMQSLPDLQELLRVQADYTELMIKVNQNISAELAFGDEEAD